MNFTKRHLLVGVLLSIPCVFLLVWAGYFVKCEVLTYLHVQEFEHAYEKTGMYGKPDEIKVLSYSDTHARIYCRYLAVDVVTGGQVWGGGGGALSCERVDGRWTNFLGQGSWSWERPVWPYVTDSPEGVLLLIEGGFAYLVPALPVLLVSLTSLAIKAITGGKPR